ncbi:unnamed protein product [Colias eurytheme]|nr:unnamed protein product [Colias eurytheme]
MSRNKTNLVDKDIERYLAQLEDGWLSEDGLEADDSEDEDPSNLQYTRDELLHLLADENDDEYDHQDNEEDPPLVEEPQEEAENQNNSPGGNILDFFLDKRKLVWKKKNMEFDEDKIRFLGSSAFPPEIAKLESPYQCFKTDRNTNLRTSFWVP